MKAKIAARRLARRLKGGGTDAARLVEHEVPERIAAGTIVAAKLVLENAGRTTWRADRAFGGAVVVEVWWDGAIADKRAMPRARVAGGSSACVHVPLRAPADGGEHVLTFKLARDEGWKLAEPGRTLLELSVTVIDAPRSATDVLQEQSRCLNHWFFQPSHGIARARDGRPYPRFFQRARGCELTDPDGNVFLDYLMGWGSSLLGYAEPRVQQAIGESLDTGPTAPFPHPLEVEIARMLCADVPGAEMAAFGKNGSDVCTLAMRLARIVTGKRKILFCGYHGWQDAYVEHKGFARSGVPDRAEPLIHPFRFDDVDDFKRVWSEHRRDLAAVMLEPAGPWTDVRHGPHGEPSAGFLRAVADGAREAKALLIFDEIITGYRVPKLCYQRRSGVTADLSCFGKAIANGMPLSALVGRAEIFQRGLPASGYGPTFKGEVYSLAAAKAAISIHRSEPVAEHVWNHGQRLKRGLDSIAKELGVAASHRGPPYRGALVFDESDPDRLLEKRTLFQQELFKHGIVTMHGVFVPSRAHGERELVRLLDAARSALEIVARADRDDAYAKLLEIPPLIG